MGYAKKQETKRVTLTDPKYWIDIAVETTWKQKKHFLWAAGNKQGANGALATPLDAYLLGIIIDWNLDDENNVKLPITQESLDMLNPDDADKIIEAAGAVLLDTTESDDSKKNSSEASPPTLAEPESPITSPSK